MKARLYGLLCLLLCCLPPCCLAEGGALRALLVGCDTFLTQQNTGAAAAQNVERMARTLENDARGYVSVTRMDQGVAGVERLEAAIAAAFAGAAADDLSLVYFCTHGLYDRVSAEPALVLSDGQSEETLSAARLREMLDAVPGVKVLLLDACNSGAFIGKGAWDERLRNSFCGSDYKVLASAGANESSFLWRSLSSLGGGSYFAEELCAGLRGRAFDLNADGVVTLREACQGLLENHGASTVQAYPQEDGFALYVYDPAVQDAPESPLSDLLLDSAVMEDGEDTVFFSFTARRAVRVQYQIVYLRDGQWRFDAPQVFEDAENAAGALLPGRKERSLTFVSEDEPPSGYVLLQLIAQEGRHAMLAGSRLIAMQPALGDPSLRVQSGEAFAPGRGEEVTIYVRHAFPCRLTAVVRRAEDGAAVRRLAYKVSSRPLGTAQECSFFYWDGRNDAGEIAPAGLYRVEISCESGGLTYRAYSESIALE